VVIKGVSSWNSGEEQSGTESANSRLFVGLTPFSDYVVQLHSRDLRGRHNEEEYNRVVLRTSPSSPPAPRRLEETPASLAGDGGTRQLRWLPPYPPQGEIK